MQERHAACEQKISLSFCWNKQAYILKSLQSRTERFELEIFHDQEV